MIIGMLSNGERYMTTRPAAWIIIETISTLRLPKRFAKAGTNREPMTAPMDGIVMMIEIIVKEPRQLMT